jgi:hypothetical protein
MLLLKQTLKIPLFLKVKPFYPSNREVRLHGPIYVRLPQKTRLTWKAKFTLFNVIITYYNSEFIK